MLPGAGWPGALVMWDARTHMRACVHACTHPALAGRGSVARGSPPAYWAALCLLMPPSVSRARTSCLGQAALAFQQGRGGVPEGWKEAGSKARSVPPEGPVGLSPITGRSQSPQIKPDHWQSLDVRLLQASGTGEAGQKFWRSRG